MFTNISISTKITSVVLLVVLITVTMISYLAYQFSRDAIETRYADNINVIADTRVNEINDYFQSISNITRLVSRMPSVRKSMTLVQSYGSRNDTLPFIYDAIGDSLRSQLDEVKESYQLRDIYLTNNDGEVVFSTNRGQKLGEFFADLDGNTIKEGKGASIYFGSVYRRDDGSIMQVSGGVTNMVNLGAGVVVVEISLEDLFTSIRDTTGLGEIGESLLGVEKNRQISYIHELRHEEENSAFRKFFTKGDPKGKPMQNAVDPNVENGYSKHLDYREKQTLASWRHIPIVNWGLVTKIDVDEIDANAEKLLSDFVLWGGVIFVLALMVAIIFSRFLISPLLALKSHLQLLGKGILPNRVAKKTNDEIGQMAQTVDNLVEGLKQTAGFAHKIGEGDFDAKFKPLSENDTLGNALLTMRDSIQESEKRDKERNWIVTGVAEIGEILRAHNELEPLGDDILAFITKKIEAIQGAFYVVNDEDSQDIFLEMLASHAYNKKKYLEAKFKFAEGLVGQSAIEQDTILRTEIPPQYVSITSGLLGDKKPSSILIVPLITDEKVYGVLEFAGFDKFSSTQIKFVEEISLIIARTIFNIKVNDRTRRLLAESQKMSTELKEQQEVLRQNAEEMEATQEELRRTNQRLEDQIQEVNRTQKRMQLLLENASEVITIYEEDGTVRYISPSVERILGYSASDMIGHKDIEYVISGYEPVIDSMFKQLIENPFESVRIQYEIRKKDGDAIWVEATGNNLLSDPAIQGILVNSRDITERRRAEQEERMRSQMQALSENSPDLITRLDLEGNFFYINPVIESYTGSGPDTYLNKSMSDVALNDDIVSQWQSILKEVDDSQEKIAKEMDFPSEMGDRVMQVNAIPEFNQEDSLESVLVVSHDITDRKLIELEIQSKNRKITESINYAKRIQGAILPNNQVIRQQLPDSFILYKARDVVSGDFPWYMQVGDDIFIAAVDCTGHGVPGALISLIGYFLLNDIVRSQKIEAPGEILDELDKGVTRTLRQDQEDSKTKDGMDIALCKINLKKNTLEYAGAHRPLYFMDGGQMNEIKGNKWPIGGGKYRNQTNFDNTTIQLKPGDSVFFCSDGFPDQFGGPQNRKFGPKRLRELIMETHGQPMESIHEVIDEKWESWKGETKQTDDVLLIGIRF